MTRKIKTWPLVTVRGNSSSKKIIVKRVKIY